MRIHSDTLTPADVYAAAAALDGVYARVTTHGSRSREAALEVHLTGNSTRRTNPGWGGGERERAATWDEWGLVLEALFAKDPSATSNTYFGLTHFRWATGRRYVTLRQADQHVNHRWRWLIGRGNECDCGAVRRFISKAEWEEAS